MRMISKFFAGGFVALSAVTTFGMSASADNVQTNPRCEEVRQAPIYVKWVRYPGTSDFVLYDNGSVTSLTPGSGYIGDVEYEYRLNGQTQEVVVEVPCVTTTTAATTTTSPGTTTTAPATTTTVPGSTTTTVPAVTTTVPGSTTTLPGVTTTTAANEATTTIAAPAASSTRGQTPGPQAQATGAVSSTQTLPSTGYGTWAFAIVAAGFCGLGGGLLALRRRFS